MEIDVDRMVRAISKDLRGKSDPVLREIRLNARKKLGEAVSGGHELSDWYAEYLRLQAEFVNRQLGNME